MLAASTRRLPMRHLLPSFALILLLASCTWVPIKKEAAGIQVLRLGQDASACRRLGEIAVSVKSGIGSWQRNPVEVRDELETLARNEALNLHADSVQPLAEPDGGRQHWLALACAHGR
jgi:hypothetical protein